MHTSLTLINLTAEFVKKLEDRFAMRPSVGTGAGFSAGSGVYFGVEDEVDPGIQV